MSPLPDFRHPESTSSTQRVGSPAGPVNPAGELRLAEACRAARLTRLQSACLLLSLARSLPPSGIAVRLEKRVCDVQKALGQARARLGATEAVKGEVNRFTRDLVFCASDLRRYDDRPPGVRGVTPDTLTRGWRCGRLIAADDLRLRQDLDAALRLWARGLLENPGSQPG